MLARAGTGALIPLRKSDLVAADCEWFRNSNRALRLLVRRVAGAHHKLAGWHDHELGAVVAVPKCVTGFQAGLRLLGHGQGALGQSHWTDGVSVATLLTVLNFRIGAGCSSQHCEGNHK